MTISDLVHEWWWSEKGPKKNSATIEDIINIVKKTREEKIWNTDAKNPESTENGAIQSFLTKYCEFNDQSDKDECTENGKYRFSQDKYKKIEVKIQKPRNSVKLNSDKKKKNSELKPEKLLNKIIYGPPGTGKTYSVIDHCCAILTDDILDTSPDNREDRKEDFDGAIHSNQIYFTTFHQSYSYEEFVEGISASTIDGEIKYAIKDGIFKRTCKIAELNPDQRFILIIDEINRGNISKIFGELITLIESTKRQGTAESLTVTLPYSQEKFSVPGNLYIIGTMNTADRSLASIDIALRRRFDFIEMMPQPDLLATDVAGVNLQKMLKRMNQRIEVLHDREHTLGHAFFINLNDKSTINHLGDIFKNKIIPLLQEYFFEDWEKIRIVLGDDRKEKDIQFIRDEPLDNRVFTQKAISEYRLTETKTYSINKEAFNNVNSYKKIYEESANTPESST